MRLVVAMGVILSTLLSGEHRGAAQAGTDDRPDPPQAFILKAPARWAPQIDNALARMARPVDVVVPDRTTPAAYVAGLCANPQPRFQVSSAGDGSGRVVVTMAPCVRVRRDVKVEVTRGDTLEGLAVRSGLSAASATSYKVIVAEGEQPKAIKPTDLKIGHTVVFPEVPLWITVLTDSREGDRAALVKALADAIGCKETGQEACLANNGVELVARAVPVADQGPTLGERALAAARTARRFETARAATDAVLASPPGASPVAAAPFGAPPGSVPVAQEQWPYDVALLATILRTDATYMATKSVIGVVDGGLADAAGAPLPREVFAPTPEMQSALTDHRMEPNDNDDDSNEWVDDLVGAGVQRVRSLGLRGTGNVALCPQSDVDYSGWPFAASHGSAVAAVAAASRLRHDDPAAGALLPRLMFYRVVDEACDPQASFGVGEAQLREAFDYLIAHRADVINISYAINRAVGNGLKDRIRAVLPNRNALLILPTPNDFFANLDGEEVCPVCLGNPARGGDVAQRVVVVGAATRQLRRANFSAYGERTVALFAPGDPDDAIDLSGRPLPPSQAAASLAAPYVALAAAIIRSFGGPNDYDDIRDRLGAATWPYDDPDREMGQSRIGVVDLVKAAAVRHYAIEVKELSADGRTWARRTYVGSPDKPLQQFVICDGEGFTELSYHAIRLGDPDAAGRRSVQLHARAVTPGTHRRRVFTHTVACRSLGDLTLTTLAGEKKAFPMANVSLILTPWY